MFTELKKVPPIAFHHSTTIIPRGEEKMERQQAIIKGLAVNHHMPNENRVVIPEIRLYEFLTGD